MQLHHPSFYYRDVMQCIWIRCIAYINAKAHMIQHKVPDGLDWPSFKICRANENQTSAMSASTCRAIFAMVRMLVTAKNRPEIKSWKYSKPPQLLKVLFFSISSSQIEKPMSPNDLAQFYRNLCCRFLEFVR